MGVVDTETICSATSSDRAFEVLDQFPEPNRSILLWLLDMCVEIADFSHVNKMTPKNLAIVIAPNLYKIHQASAQMTPQEAMENIKHCKAYTDFLEQCIEQRRTKRPVELTRELSMSSAPASPRSASSAILVPETKQDVPESKQDERESRPSVRRASSVTPSGSTAEKSAEPRASVGLVSPALPEAIDGSSFPAQDISMVS